MPALNHHLFQVQKQTRSLRSINAIRPGRPCIRVTDVQHRYVDPEAVSRHTDFLPRILYITLPSTAVRRPGLETIVLDSIHKLPLELLVLRISLERYIAGVENLVIQC